MLSLFIYCYTKGVFSSRKIERATYFDLGARFITADTHPEPDTICQFRRENEAAFNETFLEVLKLAQELKLLRVGTVSVDGTKIRASASLNKSIRLDRAKALEKQLRKEIRDLLKQAEEADTETMLILGTRVSKCASDSNELVADEENKELYRLRKQTVEPVFGIIKGAMGFRSSSTRAPESGNGVGITCSCVQHEEAASDGMGELVLVGGEKVEIGGRLLQLSCMRFLFGCRWTN